jgi:hypothetical protein
MADENKPTIPSDMADLVTDVPTRFEGGKSVMGVPLPKVVTEPFKTTPQIPSDMADLLENARPTLGQRATEVGIGTAQGAARDTPVMAGAVTGLRLGMPIGLAATPYLGPFAAAIPLTTTALGAGAGYLFGQELDRWFPAVDREDLVPYREGGKTFGSSIATAPAAFGLPVMTGNRVSRFLSAYGEAARRSPKAFMGAETITAGTMGVAGGASESYFPGQTGVRLSAELGAGLFTPSRMLFTAIDTASQALRSIGATAAQREAKTQGKATDLLLDLLDKYKEDPATLITALRQQVPKGVTPTAGQKTGSMALINLEKSLSRYSPEFGGEAANRGRQALEAYELLIENLNRLGNPEALKAAAQLRQNKFAAVLDGRLAMADADAARKISNISKDTPEARRQIGQIVKLDTEQALREARDIESELWTSAISDLTKPVAQKINVKAEVGWDRFRDRPVTKTWQETRMVPPSLKPSSTIETFLQRASEVGPAIYDDMVPSSVRKIMESFGVDAAAVQKYKLGRNTEEFINTGKIPQSFIPSGKDVPLGDLVSYRSNLLKLAREAAGKGELSNSEFYGRLADGMLSDLNKVKNPLLDEARSFSSALNDVFTRTFARTASETGDLTKAGAQRMAPEVLVTRAFGNNADVTIQRMEQVEDAVKFLRTRYDDAVTRLGKNSEYANYLKPMADLADQKVVSIQDAQNRVLRLLAGRAIDTVYDQAKGQYVQRLNTAKLTRFAQEFAPTLERLGIMGDLRDATHAQNLLLQVQKQNNVMEKTLRDQTAFAKVLSSENPTQVLGDVFNSSFPVKNFTHIVQLAKAGGPDAINGLKSAVLDYAYTKAGGMSNKFSPGAYKDALFEPLSRNQPSIVNMLRSSGAMSLTEVKDIMRLLQPMAKIEAAAKNGIPLEDVVKDADMLTVIAARYAAVHGASAIAPSGPGSLQVASMLSGAAKRLVDSLPNMTLRHVLENASKDPEMMALLLEKGRSAKQQGDILNRFLDKLGTMGVSVGKTAVTPALNYQAPEEPRPSQLRGGVQAPFTPEGQAARQLRMLPKAPSTRGVPGVTGAAPASGPTGQGAPSGAPTNANARSMFQSLFPFDTIAPMLNNQQTPS